MELGVKLENFPECHNLIIPADTRSYKVRLRLFDTQQRCLELYASIMSRIGGSVKVGVFMCDSF